MDRSANNKKLLSFLVYSYFGFDISKLADGELTDDEKKKCARRAYMDLSRTIKYKYSSSELDKAKKDYEMLKGGITNTDGNDIADTSPTFKVLEGGATTLSKEESGRLAQRQMKFIQNLQAALIRIENKTYGICRETGNLIPKERLRAVPHATLSIEAKQGGAK